MEFGDVWGYIITALGGGGITQLLNWRLNKKKNQAEVNAAEAEVETTKIENMRKAMEEFYEPLVNSQNRRITELETENARLREDMREMERTHQAQIAQLQEQILQISKAIGINAKNAIKKDKQAKKNGKA